MNRLLRIASIVFLISRALPATAADWAQAAANAARTAHDPQGPRPPFKLAWVKHWKGEFPTNANQPIIAGGVVYVGTNNGFIHAVDAETGKDLWTAEVGAPICHALACDGRYVYAAALDGAIHAFGRRSGKKEWTAKLSRRGFSAAPLLMDGAICTGNRDGVFYAVKAGTGELLWRTDTGDPIVQTAAGAEGKIVFVNEGMRGFCLDAKSGRVLWKSDPLPGRTVRDYWPVIHKGKVVIRAAQAGPRELTGNPNLLQKRLFWPVIWGKNPPPGAEIRFLAGSVDDILREQDIFVDFFKEHPEVSTFFVLNLSDGKQPYVASIVTGCRNTGVPPPPAVAGDGNMYTVFRTSAANRGLIDITPCGIGRFNIETGKLDRPVLGGQQNVGKVVGAGGPCELTSDETVTLSSGGKLLFGLRTDGGGGAIDVVTRQRHGLPCPRVAFSSDIQSTGNVVAVSGKYIAHIKFCHVVCIHGR